MNFITNIIIIINSHRFFLYNRFPDELSDKIRHVVHEQTKKQIRQQQQLQKQQKQLVQQHGKHGGIMFYI